MTPIEQNKRKLQKKRDDIFSKSDTPKGALKASLEYSLLIEGFIHEVAAGLDSDFVICSSGSFSRRELAPFSDIDITFILPRSKSGEEHISKVITNLWDHGIEASHTVRDPDDIKTYLLDDLHTFTSFFETRYLSGNRNLYIEWNNTILESLTDSVKQNMFEALIEDAIIRYEKYGNSPKYIEPNVKLTCGGFRDLQMIEWIYTLLNRKFLYEDLEVPQIRTFTDILKNDNFTSPRELERIFNSYSFLMMIRNQLHLLSNHRNDRLEFSDQIAISKRLGYGEEGYRTLMQHYFNATGILYRFNKSYIKRHRKNVYKKLPDTLAHSLDDDFYMKGEFIYCKSEQWLLMSDILRAFYYRGKHRAIFDDNLRLKIINSLDNIVQDYAAESSVFFREILRLPSDVGNTLAGMSELGVLETFLPEFEELNGFIQHGVYHCYAADEHSLKTIKNVEELTGSNTLLGRVYENLHSRELLYLALLLHDIAKPYGIAGHDILGAEMADSIMQRLGYEDTEIEMVKFLIRHHLMMTQYSFHRNLNDAETLNNFISYFSTPEELNMLYVLTFADLSAVNPVLWTSWKNDLLNELFTKSRSMLHEKISGDEILVSDGMITPEEISKHSDTINEQLVRAHIDSIDDVSYHTFFSEEEIARHVEEIISGDTVSVLFKNTENVSNITVITNDSPSLLTKLCGILLINDLNIHDAKIFTRKDGIVIDTFTVTEFRTHEKVDETKHQKIIENMKEVIEGDLPISDEIRRMKSRWWRIENKFFKRQGNVRIKFEELEKFTIIDIYSPDRIGFLYFVTNKLTELGLNTYFAKIHTNGDEVVDSFYVLNEKGKKVSRNDYPFIDEELRKTIQEIL